MRKPLLLLGAVAALLVVAALVRGCDKPTPVIIEGSGDDFARVKAERDAAVREAETFRERLTDALRGRATVPIDTLIQYDTVIPPPDTVLLYVAIDEDGRASVDAGVKADSGYAPESRRLDVSNCDDGIAIGPSGVVCNRAVLGHLELFAAVGASRETFWQAEGAAGFAWAPSYRSTLEVSAYVDTRRAVNVRLRKGVRIF